MTASSPDEKPKSATRFPHLAPGTAWGYKKIHLQARRTMNMVCIGCGATERLEAALQPTASTENLRVEPEKGLCYSVEVDDYRAMCIPCHRRLDLFTHCKRGHEYTPENTLWRSAGSGYRICRTCRREQDLEQLDANRARLARSRALNRERYRAASAAKKAGRPASAWREFFDATALRIEARDYDRARGERTHCIHGHEYTAENTIIQATGARKCRTCKNAQQQARMESNPELAERHRQQDRERYWKRRNR